MCSQIQSYIYLLIIHNRKEIKIEKEEPIQQKGFLFHPSKIQMSSTPIKPKKAKNSDPSQASTPIKTNKHIIRTITSHDHLLLEHDTPIKGHKLKNLATEIVGKYLKANNKQKDDNRIEEISLDMKNFQQHMLFGSNAKGRWHLNCVPKTSFFLSFLF